MAYIGGWYFLFALPLMAVFAISFAVTFWITGGNETAVGISLILLSPISLAFLVWQVARFVGPAYVGIIQKCGIIWQRAHHFSPADLLGSVRKQRQIASADVLKLWEKAIGS
ncbi:hypothetical protein [Ruegeria sp.]|uniref:hypothetical protein n=1 Tax=Ruegeria sp. TaxID=1879320 RepID=UPI003C797D7B